MLSLPAIFPRLLTVAVAADAIGRIKQANPRTLVLVDPILGDSGQLYVAGETAAAIRDRLLPLADVATPNLFELGWLGGEAVSGIGNVARAAQALGPPQVVVTSAGAARGTITTLLVATGVHIGSQLTWREAIPNGAGDLFAGLLLGYMLKGKPGEAALEASLAALDRVLAATSGRDVLQLSALYEAPP